MASGASDVEKQDFYTHPSGHEGKPYSSVRKGYTTERIRRSLYSKRPRMPGASDTARDAGSRLRTTRETY